MQLVTVDKSVRDVRTFVIILFFTFFLHAKQNGSKKKKTEKKKVSLWKGATFRP